MARSGPTGCLPQREVRAGVGRLCRRRGQRHGERDEVGSAGGGNFRSARRRARGRLAIYPVGRKEPARAAFGGGTFREEPPARSSRVPSGYWGFGRIPGWLLRVPDSGRQEVNARLHLQILAVSALVPFLGIVVAPGLLLSQQADRFAAVAPRMQEFVDKGEISGAVTLVATRDRIIHLNAVGKTDIAKERKMRTDDIFWIASMTKPITAVCIAILADEGKLRIDGPLAEHLPEFAGLMVSENGQTARPSRPVTLRDLLRHTSGMGEMITREPHLTLAETSERLSHQPLRFQPGTRWAYSTAAIDLLGRVV